MRISALLDSHQELRAKIFEHFGYVEDWRIYPIVDDRNFYWKNINDEEILFAEDVEDLVEEDSDYYSYEVFKDRFLPKWIYRSEDLTMVLVDTHTDGNRYLAIFANDNEITE